MSSSIIKRRKTSNYTQISNLSVQEGLNDMAAIGLLVYVMSLPEDWILRKSHLHNHFTRRKVDSAWKVLVENKYVIGFYCHVNGQKNYFYNVSDIPFTQDDYDQFVIEVKEELESDDNSVYNIEPIKDSPFDISTFSSGEQNVQYTEDNSKRSITKEIKTKETDTNKYQLSIVNKESDVEKNLTTICNEYYPEFVAGRWSKKEWTTLVKKFVAEMIANKKHLQIHPNKLKGYIYKALQNMADHHDYKHSEEFKEYQQIMSQVFNE